MSKIIEAIHQFQSEAPNLQRDKINPHFGNQYLSLELLLQTLLPMLNDLGLVLTQEPTTIGETTPGLRTTLTHVEEPEYKITSEVPLILDRNSPQAVGSSITYMRRYSLMSMLGLTADPDDDAERGEGRSTAPTTRF